ncbi:MAG: hypothetical protein QM681_22125 [Novosphingobium sp.]
MNRKLVPIWAVGVTIVAVLNILDVLPDWATFAAVLTLPVLSSACAPRLRGA